MAQVASEHRVTLLDRGYSDHQIVERPNIPLSRFLALNLTHKPSCTFTGWMHRDQVRQLFDIRAPPTAILKSLRPVDPMYQLGNRNRRQRKIHWPKLAQDCLNKNRNRLPAALRADDNARVED